MQQRSCENIRLLLSKYADNEASPSEMERVDNHVATCADCARRLTKYMQVSAIFSSEVTRAPEPQLRAGLFQEIHRLQEEQQRKQRRAKERPWYLPLPAPNSRRPQSAIARLWETASPFVAGSMAVFALLALAVFLNRTPSVTVTDWPPEAYYPPVPSIALTNENAVVMGTAKTADVVYSPTSIRTTSLPTAVTGEEEVFRLAQPRPVMEAGDVAQTSTWHVVRDPASGYTVSYPPNWWTHVAGQTRYFFPWGRGGTRYAPYGLDLRVESNPKGFTAETANEVLFNGSGAVIPGTEGTTSRLRRTSSDANNAYDELYSFDSRKMYILRVSVPGDNPSASFKDRSDVAEAVFSTMSGRLSITLAAASGLGNAPVLFLGHSDLWSLGPGTEQVTRLTYNYGVRQYARSPDMRAVAFTSAKNTEDLWGTSLYVTYLEGNLSTPVSLWPGATEIRDIAWYGDHELVAIGKVRAGGLGVYRIQVPRAGEAAHETATLIASLQDTLQGARGLSISPDRQLITFLAPIGPDAGTDLYALRPDGSDLRKLISHTDPLALTPDGGRVYLPNEQALKTYTWVSGHLEPDGYAFRLLFTCGNSNSPTLDKGGFFYSAPGYTVGPLLDQNRLRASDPMKMQVIHVAYSTDGKVAITGYYNDRNGRAKELAGLWTADIADGQLVNIQSRPTPDSPHGIADLQWSADGRSLVYRETMPQDAASLSDRYDSFSPFQIVRLDLATGQKRVVYSGQ